VTPDEPIHLGYLSLPAETQAALEDHAGRKRQERLGGIETFTITASEPSEVDIRRDERRKVAALLDEHAEVLTSFAASPEKLLALVAFMLRLDPGGAS
jgi:hypothetical protein